MNLLYREESFIIRGALYEVYSEIGSGFLEAIYQECLEKEFKLSGIPFTSQQQLKIDYKGETLVQTYKPDFICYDSIIVEIKAVQAIRPEHIAQIINYLKLTEFQLGFLVNFSSYPKLDIRRIVNTKL
ncbi:MAG: GxxExxY protein [Marinifilaceae bacterium]|jgi:GxxExxY protein|nr:GxxExxY protein [Marinifilaceae bacterium]